MSLSFFVGWGCHSHLNIFRLWWGGLNHVFEWYSNWRSVCRSKRLTVHALEVFQVYSHSFCYSLWFRGRYPLIYFINVNEVYLLLSWLTLFFAFLIQIWNFFTVYYMLNDVFKIISTFNHLYNYLSLHLSIITWYEIIKSFESPTSP